MSSLAPKVEIYRTSAIAGRFNRLIDGIERYPARAFAAFALFHAAVWTLLPTLLCRNLPTDVLEGIIFGQHWQWGYWKHPPLPWLLVDIVRRLTAPHLWGFLLLGQLAAVSCFWAVWRLGCEIFRPIEALAGTMLLDGCVTFNLMTSEVNHNIVQLPFFGLAGWSLYRAFVRGKSVDWALVGVWFAFAFYSKYTAATLLLPLLLFSIVDPMARRCWSGRGVYLAILVFAVLMAPHAVWLVGSGFSPVRFANDSANQVDGLSSVLFANSIFAVNALASVVGALLIFWFMLGSWWQLPKPAPASERFAQRYLAVLAFGPFVVSIVAGVLLQRSFPAGWSSQFWCFIGLFFMGAWRLRIDSAALRRLLLGWAVFSLEMVGVYFAAQVFLLGRGSNMSTQFPGEAFAAAVTAAWHKETGKPLSYVVGDLFESGTLVLYSAGNVEAYHNANAGHMPWIDEADLRRRGAVLLWVSSDPQRPDYLGAFPKAQPRPPFVMRQATPGGELVWTIQWAYLPPARP